MQVLGSIRPSCQVKPSGLVVLSLVHSLILALICSYVLAFSLGYHLLTLIGAKFYTLFGTFVGAWVEQLALFPGLSSHLPIASSRQTLVTMTRPVDSAMRTCIFSEKTLTFKCSGINQRRKSTLATPPSGIRKGCSLPEQEAQAHLPSSHPFGLSTYYLWYMKCCTSPHPCCFRCHITKKMDRKAGQRGKRA